MGLANLQKMRHDIMINFVCMQKTSEKTSAKALRFCSEIEILHFPATVTEHTHKNVS